METPPKHAPENRTKEEDIDLGKLFDKTGSAISSFFAWLGRAFEAVGNALLNLLFLVRRNLFWLLLGLVIGGAIGFFLQTKNGQRYTSTMTVRTNFNSSRALYSTIDYFNALIENRQIEQLSKIFGISAAEAASLNFFEVNPVKSENIVSDMYNQHFVRQDRNAVRSLDTFWTKTIPYKEYKNSLTKFDYPIHDITLIASNLTVFQKVQAGLTKETTSNVLLQEMKQAELSANNAEVELLASSIRSIDTLKNVYNQRLVKESDRTPSTNVTLVDGNREIQAPELELYDKLIELKNELKTAKVNSVLESDVLMIYAPFGKYGEKEGLLKHNIVRWSIIGLLIALAIIFLLAFNKYLTSLELHRSKNPQDRPNKL